MQVGNQIEKDFTSTRSWIFIIGRDVISWVSKKHSHQVDSTMAAKFIASASTTQEVELSRYLFNEIPLWPKPTATILIHCDNEARVSKACS